MIADGTLTALAGGVGLLERALGYTLGGLALVTPTAMANRTPCAGWDLRALLRHMNDSLLTMHEAITAGHLTMDPLPAAEDPAGDCGDPEADPVGVLRNRGCRMLGAWVNSPRLERIAIEDKWLAPMVVAAAGAVEVAVHGWDVAAACGQDRPIPSPLADELLELGPLLVRPGDRPGRFDPPIEVPTTSPAGDRLVAFLGRDPRTARRLRA